ncbi:mannose-6-phosphate isomerase-like protein (cupin superfamily) [Hydrogenispora ethanolica]|uniref:Mannose-6-phosphate isomerase-like protein (Cupin superfamily) n=1 Tax=Hydrogenispora ethanolica TaxID=1082276 RepID=A0A4R1SBJ3_HYDET|nr:cupin domain-containing protein [Hydrogenispora ethanolica]TCL76926.1 mannose-6-phosphate isomerase-like protein (cupin superfamily) [Hydrogenispora ethanolica]
MLEKVNLAEKLRRVDDHWHARLVGEVNDFQVKIVKLLGDFVWHRHEAEDEMFLVVKGELTIQLRDGDVRLAAGEFLVVPKGVEHRPSAAAEVEVLLFESKTTVNTGNVTNERTRTAVDRI